ncbi:contractile injection system tape measure protein [Streptomyces sp. NPDC005017]|uniref:contractile injection system tape measure protein n=1 Tax=Streptomyces sp. NPDC005017 TaxID=3364706 RepID=UPI0036946619
MTAPTGTAVDLRLERLTILCRTTPEDQERALAVRARLARLAAERLPAALARALGVPPGAGVPDLRLDRLVVPLGFDPVEYDDETVVLMWAEHIRAAIAGRMSVPRPAPAGEPAWEPVPSTAGDGPRPPDAGQQGVGTRLPPDLGVRLSRLSNAALTRVARELAARPEALSGLWRALGTDERRAVSTALATSRQDCGPSPEAGRLPVEPGPSAEEGAVATTPVHGGEAHAHADRAGDAEWATLWQARAAQSTTGTPADATDAESFLAALLEPAGHPSSPDSPLLSRAGGLVLLYPWLGDYLAEAVDALGRSASPAVAEAAEADLRRVALAVLTDPADPDLQSDPLVMVLAGQHPGARVPRIAGGTPAEPAAEAALRRFAAAVPGFAQSSAAYIRTGFLRRPARLQETADGQGTVEVELGRLPLDIALSRLPYPLALFQLPWSPPVRIRFAAAPPDGRPGA